MVDHIFPANSLVNSNDREKLLKQKSIVVWLTGLSGSGKSTLGKALEKKLLEEGHAAYLLDGDSLRTGLNKDLGFSIDDRNENIRRAGEVCKLFADAGLIVITAFISPLLSQRNSVREKFENGKFLEVYVKASLETCEKRDVKGLYKKARAGEIKDFTGVDSPYEEPASPEIIIDTEKLSGKDAIEKLYNEVKCRVR